MTKEKNRYFADIETESESASYYSNNLENVINFVFGYCKAYEDENCTIQVLNAITGELLLEFENKRFMTGWKQSRWITDSLANDWQLIKNWQTEEYDFF